MQTLARIKTGRLYRGQRKSNSFLRLHAKSGSVLKITRTCAWPRCGLDSSMSRSSWRRGRVKDHRLWRPVVCASKVSYSHAPRSDRLFKLMKHGGPVTAVRDRMVVASTSMSSPPGSFSHRPLYSHNFIIVIRAIISFAKPSLVTVYRWFTPTSPRPLHRPGHPWTHHPRIQKKPMFPKLTPHATRQLP